MPGIKKNRKTYNQPAFRKTLISKLNEFGAVGLKDDNSDLLIYLIYINYLNDLIRQSSTKENGFGNEGTITEERLENVDFKLLKKHRG
ncbi:unnamed protein product [Candida verbasci]|uniref:Uncharacterized protein n=1 Tax=Candida verbasci TaxID=1227364 RepID=A0A9W4TR17_9ASCO|nr:unnamed protein product [Candida verbasci]